MRKRPGEGAPDARSAAGDERDLFRQVCLVLSGIVFTGSRAR